MSFLHLPETFRPDRYVDSPYLEPDARRVLAELEGPGCIRHLWMALPPRAGLNRQVILRIYWDDEAEPSVEAPLGDFFGLCHGIPWYALNSRYLSVQPQSGMNCWFAMPFSHSARVEVETGPDRGAALSYHLDWQRYDELTEPLRFHAKWRREFPAAAYGEDYTVLEAEGRGRLMGFVYGVRVYDDRDPWTHAGAETLYLDGEGEPVLVRGSGGEDTFGASYGGGGHTPGSHLDAGIPYHTLEDTGASRPAPRLAAYRFFGEEGLPFEHSLHFRFGSLANDLCSTVYWYQTEPHREYYRMPLWAKLMPGVQLLHGECDVPDKSGGEWWLCGPFENAEGEAMDTSLPPEEGFDPEVEYPGGFHSESPWRDDPDKDVARWVRRREIHHFVDFNHVFRPMAQGVAVSWPAAAVARTTLRAPRSTEARFVVAWDDELTLQLNDDRLLDCEPQQLFRAVELPVTLRQGDNEVILKLSNTKGKTWGAWCFAFRCVLPEGTVLKPTAAKA